MKNPPNQSKEARPRGRPTEFSLEKCEELIDLMSLGLLDVEICAKWDISRDTFYRWKREHEQFAEAYNIGFPKCEAYWIQNYFKKMASGELEGKHSFNSVIAIANNKFGWKKDAESTTNINIGNVNVLQTKSSDELLEFIKAKVEETRLIEIIDVNIEPEQAKLSGIREDGPKGSSEDS